MSKKVFLKTWEKSFAEIEKDGIIDGDLQEGVPGFSILKPELCCFKYTDRNNTRTIPRPTTVPKSPKKPYCQRKRSTFVEDDISDIIEISSSPEKSPFKEDIFNISSDSSSCSSRKRVRRHCKVESDDSDLPSLEEVCSKPVLPEKETNLVQESSVSDKHFGTNPGKCFSNIYTAFTTVNRGLTAGEILEVLLNPDDYDTCAGVPQYDQEPAAFLIDSNVLKDKKDIRADGNGVWSCRNKPKRYYRLEENGKAHMVKGSAPETNKVHQVVRSYSSHKDTPSFRRLIIEIVNCSFVILQFYFIGSVVAVTIKPHGNTKKNNSNVKPYRRVAQSTLQRITELSKDDQSSAKGVLKDIIDENGGMENISVNLLPRNPQQVRNLKHKLSEEKKDEISEILHMYDTQTDNFIRKVDIRPDLVVVLASNQQICDLERFCTKKPFSMLGIDPTFHFGDFDVTVTTYRHQMLDENTPGKHILNRHPVFAGPVCIHKKKDTQSYYNFLSTLVAKNNELRKMKAIGTDGETALSNALLMAFENAVHLRCLNHVSKNVKNKLKDIGVSKNDKSRILTDIFGSTGDISLKMTGLTDCLTHAEFDQKLDQLKLKWENAVQGFWTWFKRNQSDTIKHHMIQSLRSEAGLAQMEMYITNDNEGINSALQRVCGKNQPVSKFVEMIKDFIKSQVNQLLLAIV